MHGEKGQQTWDRYTAYIETPPVASTTAPAPTPGAPPPLSLTPTQEAAAFAAFSGMSP